MPLCTIITRYKSNCFEKRSIFFNYQAHGGESGGHKLSCIIGGLLTFILVFFFDVLETPVLDRKFKITAVTNGCNRHHHGEKTPKPNAPPTTNTNHKQNWRSASDNTSKAQGGVSVGS